MLYQVGLRERATCKETISVKILTIKVKVQCVVWFHETKSLFKMQRTVRRCYGWTSPSPSSKSIKRFYNRLKETDNIADLPRNGTPSLSKTAVGHVGQSFQCSQKC